MTFFTIKKNPIWLFFYAFLILLSFFRSPAYSEDILPMVVSEASERLNLIGFLPPEKRPSYLFRSVEASDEVISSLVAGTSNLGFLSPLDFLKARSENVPLVALASPLQYTPIAFAYQKNVFRRSYEDLKGRAVLYEPGTLGEILFKCFLRRVNISPKEMVWIPLAPGQKKSFKKADIIVLDKISEILHFSKNLETDKIIFPHEFGIYFKGPLMVTTQNALENHPAEVKALAKEALEIFKFNIFNQKNIYTALLQKTIPYIFQTGEPLGVLTEKDWWQMERLLLEEGVLAKPVPLENGVYLRPSSLEKKRTLITLALPGLPSADFSGFYVAEDQGYYERSGQGVQLRHFASEKEVIETVRSGKSLIGVASSLSLLRAQVENPNLKILGVIYQEDPIVFLARFDSLGKGKTNVLKSTVRLSEEAEGALLGLLASTPYKKEDLHLDVGYPSIFNLIDEKVALISSREIPDDPRVERYREILKIMPAEKRGLVGLSIFTTQSSYENNRDSIKSILKSTFHGYENSIFQTENSAESIMSRDGSLSFKDLKRILKDNSLYIKDSHGIIGSINPEKWNELVKLAVERKFLDKNPDLSQFFPDEVKTAT